MIDVYRLFLSIVHGAFYMVVLHPILNRDGIDSIRFVLFC